MIYNNFYERVDVDAVLRLIGNQDVVHQIHADAGAVDEVGAAEHGHVLSLVGPNAH